MSGVRVYDLAYSCKHQMQIGAAAFFSYIRSRLSDTQLQECLPAGPFAVTEYQRTVQPTSGKSHYSTINSTINQRLIQETYPKQQVDLQQQLRKSFIILVQTSVRSANVNKCQGNTIAPSLMSLQPHHFNTSRLVGYFTPQHSTYSTLQHASPPIHGIDCRAGMTPTLPQDTPSIQQRRYATSSQCEGQQLQTNPNQPEDVLNKTVKDMAIVYTCGQCDTRSVKQFSKKAYYEGLVLVRCPTCRSLHLIADRLGWFGEAGDIEDFIKDGGVRKGDGVDSAQESLLHEDSAPKQDNPIIKKLVLDGTVEISPEDVLGQQLTARLHSLTNK